MKLQRKELRRFCLAMCEQFPTPTTDALRQLLDDHEADLSEDKVTVIHYLTTHSRLSLFSPE